MALDKWTDDILISGLKRTRLVRYIATEEQPGIIEIDNPKNQFGIVIDPLDGSSLIDREFNTINILSPIFWYFS
jgi:fructose-1,6-bisphosphatase I